MEARLLNKSFSLTAFPLSLGVAAIAVLYILFAAYDRSVTEAGVTAAASRLEAHWRQEAEELAGLARFRLSAPVAKGDESAIERAAAEFLEESSALAAIEITDGRGRLLYSRTESVDTDLRLTRALDAAPDGPDADAAAPKVTLVFSRRGVDTAVSSLRVEARRSATRRLLLGLGLMIALVAAAAVAARYWFDASAGHGTDEPGHDETSTTSVIRALRSESTGELLPDRTTTGAVAGDYLETLLSSMSEAVIITSPHGVITRVNRATCELLGYAKQDLVGRNLQSLFAPGHKSDYTAQASITTPRETVFRTRRGDEVPVSFTRSKIYTEDPELQGTIMVARNISERKKSERRVRYLARYDALTRVANRMQFQHLLQRAIARMKRKELCLALLYLDLDRFKDINDTFGHLAGDRSLETVSRRLVEALPRDTVIGRLAGDEFAVILDGLVPSNDVKARVANIARMLLRELARTFSLKEHEVVMTASMGIAFYPEDGGNVIDLIRNADAAMYHAKQNGGNRFDFYDPAMNADEVDRLMLKSQLRRALEREELKLLYQPKIDLRDGKVVGAEALLRWHSKEHGEVRPSVFIPLAEESDLILDLGEWVLNQVCTDYKRWMEAVPAPGRVAVNLSLKQLRQIKIIQRIKSIFIEHSISPTCLELEITETTLMKDAEKTLQLLDELYGLGLHLSIDDFGTGYSSLSALQQFPITTLKIDKSFVRDAAVDSDDATIVKTIIEMGQSLDMEVVAEGVETEEQLTFLRQQNCTYAQGHLFGDPMTADQFLELLTAQAQGTDTHRALFG